MKRSLVTLVFGVIAAGCGSADPTTSSSAIPHDEVAVVLDQAFREPGVRHLPVAEAAELLERDVELGDDRVLLEIVDMGSSSCPPERLIGVEPDGDTVVIVRDVPPEDEVCTADVVTWVTIVAVECDDVVGLVGADADPLTGGRCVG